MDYHDPFYNLKSLLEASSKTYAERVAILHHDEAVTYQQLNERANQLADLLISKGVGPEKLVPVCLDAGIDLIVGLMGVIKAGAAYVPIDPDFPNDRIAYMCGDCAAKVVITSSRYRKKFNRGHMAELVELDTPGTVLGDCKTTDPLVNPGPENLAYVIYTSGTTGQPNGVMVSHRSVVNNLLWARRYFNISPGESVMQKTTFCFDVSVWEIFWSLICGARLVVIGKEDYRNIGTLKQMIMERQLSILHFIPTMLELFLMEVVAGECSSVRFVICSGEALTSFQADLLKAKLPQVRLFNLYGPTETTIHSSYWEAPLGGGELKKILIGKPIDATEIFILDEKRELHQNGSVGEIYIGGVGVARGYLNNPALTAERFIHNPLVTGSGRLFKTGDFGRYHSDGNIEYLGRKDDRVKINGYRIELESIEHTIKGSGGVKYAVVVTGKNAKGFLQILAYVILLPGYHVHAIWDYLITKLPGYMLPNTIYEIDSIPFTHNGKIDKARLLLSHSKLPGNQDGGPKTEMEKVLHTIWKGLFRTDELSIYDSFFDLGGTSILALQLLAQIKQLTNTRLSFLLLNQYPTIESLAKLLARPNMIEIPNALISITEGGNKSPLYLVNGGGLVADGFFNLSDELDPEQPVFGFQTNGYDENGISYQTIEAMAASYVDSMVSENSVGPYNLAGYSLGGIIAFEMARQLKAMGKEVRSLIMIDSVSRDPELIKTKYNPLTVLRMILLNLYLFKQSPRRALNYTIGVFNAVIKKIKGQDHAGPKFAMVIPDLKAEDPFSVFNLQVAAYQYYKLQAYEGNIAVFRAKEITFYMDDFKYLGWRPYAREVKSIGINGNHYSIFDNVNIKTFGYKLQQLLDEGY